MAGNGGADRSTSSFLGEGPTDPPPADRIVQPERALETSPPVLASPGLVLVAALSIMEGYRWLNVIPARWLHPSALVYVTAAVPLLVLCTRRQPGQHRGPVQWVGVASASGLVVATLTESFVRRPWSAHVFGASNMAVAAVALGAAWAIGRTDSVHRRKGDAPRQ